MAKDTRLYARFDIGMDENPKVMPLSDAAFRALVESTLYARRQLTDGFLDARIVAKKWGQDVADELSSNDPERPSWLVVEGGYMIHDFAEHQVTTTDIEAKREAGRRGGLAKAKQKASTPVAPASEVLEQNASKTLAKTETETETLPTYVGSTRASARGQTGTRIPADFKTTPHMIAWALENTPNVNHQAATQKFKAHYRSAAGPGQFKTDWTAAWEAWMLGDQERASKEPQQFKTAAERKLDQGRANHALFAAMDAENQTKELTP